MGLALGQTFDRYVIEALVGEGGMGSVYRAYDSRLHRQVALKILRVDEGAEPQATARLLREARAVAALNHPNAVAVYDVGTVDGHPFIAMELIVGQSLRAYVGDATRSLEQRVLWMTDIARALAAAHACGLVHRDIKPENVMVREDGELKVLDFGVARRVMPEGFSGDTITQEGAVVGTPLYMAPEQLYGGPLDPRGDQFAWGVVAYELLTGARPWSEESGYRAIAEILTQPTPPPSTREPAIPRFVDAVVTRALAKAPGDRFASMKDVVDALDERKTPAPPPRSSPWNATAAGAEEDPGRGDRPPKREETGGTSVRTPPTGETFPRSVARRRRWVARGGVLAAAGWLAAIAMWAGRHRPPLGSPPLRSGAVNESAPSSESAHVIANGKGERSGVSDAAAAVDGGPGIELRRAIAVLGLGDVRAAGARGEKPTTGARGTRQNTQEKPATESSSAENGAPKAANDAWQTTAISELLAAELATGGNLRVVSGEQVARARLELGMETREQLTPDVLPRFRQHLGVDLVVSGHYVVVDGPKGRALELQVMLQDAGSGAIVMTVTDAAPETDLFPLVARVGKALREALGVSEPSAKERAEQSATVPSDVVTARLYAQGLAAAGALHPKEALDLFARVTARSPRFALGHAHAAMQMMFVGDDEGAVRAAKRAQELAADLPREEKLRIDALVHYTASEWEQAARAYQALFTFYPDNVEYGILETQMLSKGLHPKDALNVVTELKKLPAPLSDDPRIEYEEARAYHMESDYPHCLAAALEAKKKADAQGHRIVWGMAGYMHGIAVTNLGHADEGLAILVEAKNSARDLGDIRTVGVLQAPIAYAYAARGDLAKAHAEAEEGRAGLLAVGNTYFATSAWEQMGAFEVERGELSLGRRKMEDAIAYYRKTQSRHALSGGLPQLGLVMANMGDPASGRALVEEGRAIAQGSGRKTAETSAEIALAYIARAEGDMDAARKHQARAKELSDAAAFKSGAARALHAMGDTARIAGDLATARAKLEEALALRETLNERLRAEETKASLARLALDEEKPEIAESLARSVAIAAETFDAGSLRASALGVLARALSTLGRTADAEAALTTAMHLAPSDTGTHLEIRLAGARIHMATGDSGVRSELTAIARDAAQVRHEDAALEARVLLAIHDAKTRRDASSGSLASARAEAERRGFGALVREITGAAAGALR